MKCRDLGASAVRTREAVTQIVCWCLIIALHQTQGIGKKRQELLAGATMPIQKWVGEERRQKTSRAVIAEMQKMLGEELHCEVGDLGVLRVPLRRAPRNRKEEQLRMAGDSAATLSWLIFALGMRRALHFGAQRLQSVKEETFKNYQQFNEWALDGEDWAFSKLQHCAQQALREDLELVPSDSAEVSDEALRATAVLQQVQGYEEAIDRAVRFAQMPRGKGGKAPLAVLSRKELAKLAGDAAAT